MAKHLRYMGEFLSRAGVVWRVEILQEADTPFTTVSNLTFEADEALNIEWPETSKENVICGSTAVIRVESPGDRTYEDLYTIEVGRIRMDVYCNNLLYWSGTLDPEFYEEPYEKAAHYVVTLTFSDFGILERLRYDLVGMQTLKAIVDYALDKSQINYTALDAQTYCTTLFTDDTKADISKLSIRSDNFIDEDGEANTLKEAIEGILQPLALRIVQRNGKIYVYDLNGLYSHANSRAIVWAGDEQTLGVDKVANNVKVTFSPYASAMLMDGEVEYKGEYGADKANFGEGDPQDAEYGEFYSYLPEYYAQSRVTAFDIREATFSLFIGEGSGLQYVNPNARYFHIEPLSGAASTKGVAWGFYSGGAKRYGGMTGNTPNPGRAQLNVTTISKGSSTIVYKTNRVFLPKLSDADRAKYLIRLSLEMLLDARYNPYTTSKSDNDGTGNHIDNYWDNDNGFKVWTGWAFIPVGITLYDVNGNAIAHYKNKDTVESGVSGIPGMATGQWISGAANFGDAWLEYYNPDDLKEDAGIRGWKANRHCIGRPDVSARKPGVWLMYDSFKQMPDGEYIPYPENGGYLEITLFEGVRCFDYGEDTGFGTTYKWWEKSLYSKIRWLLYKAPKIELIKSNLVFDNAELDDVEYSGYINKAAKDDISIDTICGTAATVCPTARGILCRVSTNEQITLLKREGVTDHPERLLIGTLYSQFADRKTKLRGEADLDPGALCTYTELNQSGKKFLLTADKQDCITGISEVTIIELKPDEYEAIEEVNDNG